jgi:hypothetical protein
MQLQCLPVSETIRRSCLCATANLQNIVVTQCAMWFNFMQAECVNLRGNAIGLNSGGGGLLFQPRHRLSWLRFFVIFLSPPGKCRDSTMIKQRPLPSKFVPIHHHSYIILLSDAIYSRYWRHRYRTYERETDNSCTYCCRMILRKITSITSLNSTDRCLTLEKQWPFCLVGTNF